MAKTYEMTVHEALSELKTLGSRISKEISRTTFVTTNKHSNTKIDGKSIEDFKKEMRSNLQSINDLIARRSAIKRAVTLSNANTKIIIKNDNQEMKMTVAEAIEYKAVGVSYKQALLDRITAQYNHCVSNMQEHNGEWIEVRADDYVHNLFGGKEKDIDVKSVELAKKAYIENNTLDLIDPNNMVEGIKILSNEIDFFNSKVDAAISVSNATTIITFSV